MRRLAMTPSAIRLAAAAGLRSPIILTLRASLGRTQSVTKDLQHQSTPRDDRLIPTVCTGDMTDITPFFLITPRSHRFRERVLRVDGPEQMAMQKRPASRALTPDYRIYILIQPHH